MLHHRIEEFAGGEPPRARAVCVLFALGSSNAECNIRRLCRSCECVIFIVCYLYYFVLLLSVYYSP